MKTHRSAANLIDLDTIRPLRPDATEDEFIARADHAIHADRLRRQTERMLSTLNDKERVVLARRFDK